MYNDVFTNNCNLTLYVIRVSNVIQSSILNCSLENPFSWDLTKCWTNIYCEQININIINENYKDLL